jgi:hypothetical protein
LESFSEIVRATASAAPPGGKGTTRRMGLLGQLSWATARPAIPIKAAGRILLTSALMLLSVGMCGLSVPNEGYDTSCFILKE